VYVHIVRMEQKLGRLLRKGELVHHRDGDRLNNDPDNLELTNRKKHGKTHAKPQEMVALTCVWCGMTFSRRKGQDPDAKGYSQAYCSRSCNGKANGFGSL
jgi:hypothetical protein